ncbi:MAG: Rrf2 family transcriptional regulator [Candidatus Eisenbacteria bacterium]|nr:Rrf2 family transcriptional regulator [Candidatus Eisenbacteria bacterium]
MISQGAEYALRAVLCLAGRETGRASRTQIAGVTRVPAGYLAKILQALSRAGLVKSTPGRSGGFQLARPVDQITVLDVVNAVDPVARITRCPLGLESHGAELCPLHKRLAGVLSSVERAFSETKIVELLGQPSPVQSFCDASPR